MQSNTARSVTFFASNPHLEGGCAPKLPEAVKALFIARCTRTLSYQRFLRAGASPAR
jgi:hypothetical protein